MIGMVSEMLCGELQKVQIELTNIGRAPVKTLLVGSTTPQLFSIVDLPSLGTVFCFSKIQSSLFLFIFVYLFLYFTLNLPLFFRKWAQGFTSSSEDTFKYRAETTAAAHINYVVESSR